MSLAPLPRLGALETEVLEHVWTSGPSDARAVFRAVGEPRRITLNTVQSAMTRLFRKDLLARERVGHGYVYRPRLTREELGARVVQHVVGRLLGGDALLVLEAFVDLAARTDEANLDRLARLVAARRTAR